MKQETSARKREQYKNAPCIDFGKVMIKCVDDVIMA